MGPQKSADAAGDGRALKYPVIPGYVLWFPLSKQEIPGSINVNAFLSTWKKTFIDARMRSNSISYRVFPGKTG